jgi:hypothetical protein
MGSLSDYSENKLLEHVFYSELTPPATLYVGLFTADPTDTGSLANEVADSNGYSRVEVTFSSSFNRTVANDSDLTFPATTGSWGDLTHWAILDSATLGSGNVLAHGSLSATFATVTGNTVRIAEGDLWVKMNDSTSGSGFTTYLADNLLNLLFCGTSYSVPSTYVALYHTDLSDSSDDTTDATEVSGTGYARVLVNPNSGSSPKWSIPSSGSVENASEISIGPPTGTWTQIVALAVVDSSGVGKVLCYDNNVVDQTPLSGDTVSFPASSLSVTLS